MPDRDQLMCGSKPGISSAASTQRITMSARLPGARLPIRCFVVVTHRPPANAADKWPNTTFVDGVEAAVIRAKEIAGDKNVIIASANVTQQALDLGLLDEVCVSLVPVLFGEGVPYFSTLKGGHLLLDDPIVVQGRRALHLRYPVRR